MQFRDIISAMAMFLARAADALGHSRGNGHAKASRRSPSDNERLKSGENAQLLQKAIFATQ